MKENHKFNSQVFLTWNLLIARLVKLNTRKFYFTKLDQIYHMTCPLLGIWFYWQEVLDFRDFLPRCCQLILPQQARFCKILPDHGKNPRKFNRKQERSLRLILYSYSQENQKKFCSPCSEIKEKSWIFFVRIIIKVLARS